MTEELEERSQATVQNYNIYATLEEVFGDECFCGICGRTIPVDTGYVTLFLMRPDNPNLANIDICTECAQETEEYNRRVSRRRNGVVINKGELDVSLQ